MPYPSTLTPSLPDVVRFARDFPPGLNTSDPAADLKPGETPDSYGFDLTKDGRIVKGTIASGTARVIGRGTIAAWVTGTAYVIGDLVTNTSVYYVCLIAHTAGTFATDLAAAKWKAINLQWHYSRLWHWPTTSGTTLSFGSPNIDYMWTPQRLGKIPFTEDSNAILALVPFGTDSLFVAKSTGSYILSNCADSRAFIQRSCLIQEMACPAATQIVELDGVVYVSNSNGLMAYQNGEAVEVSRKIRASASAFGSLALTVDYATKRVICGTTYVYDATGQKWFNYSGSSFLYTTPQFRFPDYRPFTVDRFIVALEHSDTSGGTLTYQVRYENQAWQPAKTMQLPYQQERYTRITEDLEQSTSCRRFQIKVTALSANKYLKEIALDAESLGIDDYGV